MSDMVPFLAESAQALFAAFEALALPLLFFIGIGFAAKGRRLVADALRAAGESALNLQIMAFNVLLVVPLIGLGSTALSALFMETGLILLEPESWLGLPPLAVLAIAVFVGDFAAYWRHRLEHTPLLWPSHAVHHSDTEMTWLTLERFHPINRITTFALDSSVLLILGLPPFAIVANNLVRHYYGYFIHADLPWTYGRLGLIFVSPAMHRWHHAADSRFFDTNYATVFSLFDRAFGTFRVPGPCTAPLGVTDDIARTLLGQMRYPLTRRAYARLFRSARRPAPAPQPAGGTEES